MRLSRTRLAFGTLLRGLPSLAPAQVHVDAGASGAGDGSRWANAYTDLHSALLNHPGEEIWVAKGVYVPTSTDPQGDRRIASFSLRPGTALYGGFAGGETLHAAQSGDQPNGAERRTRRLTASMRAT